MGDSEAVTAEATAAVSFPVAEYNHSSAASYADASSDVAPVPGNYTVEAAASHFPGGSDYGGDPNNAAGGGQNNTGVDSSVNGNLVNETGNATENGNAFDSSAVGSAAVAYVDGSAPVMSAEEERLWSILRANSSDFNAWTALIEETEKVAENDVVKIRKVYDTFLAEFPLCYGYWKKYADHEARIGSMDKVVEVYERAVQAVTYSVDIWLLYCVFAMETYGDPETIRRLFERGLAYVGTDYLSAPLWDKYIEYEYMHQEWGRLASIYTRILEHPIQQLDKYLTSFRELAGSRPLSELRTAEESATVAEGVGSEAGGHTTEGEAHSDTGEKSPGTVNSGITEVEELKKYIAIREEMYQKAKEFDSKIIGFETAIRRPYFHVRPLSIAELENWHNYLDFMEREGDFNKVFKLYERCLIACANYPEYWMRYTLSMETSQSLDLAENALARATQVFVKRRSEIHLFAARFKEQNGDIAGARAAYQLVHTEISPGLFEAIVKHANMERRLGNVDDAYSLYEQTIAIEKGKEQSQILPMLYAQYSRFMYLVSGDAEKAREILRGALDHIQLSKPFLEALIHLETILPTKQIDYLGSLVHKFVTSNSDSSITTNTADREDLSSIFLEFLGLFGDLQSIKSAEDRHAKLFLPHKPFSEIRKRHAEDFLASDRVKLAKSSLAASSPAPSLMGAYPTSQNQWPAPYGAQTQAWPPVTQAQAQAQPQQWAPGYAQQQAGYGTYNSTYTGSYAAPQVPVSVPQSTAYAYPSTYPVQSYAQPTAAATLTPVQQPAAAVSQNYYGNYY